MDRREKVARRLPAFHGAFLVEIFRPDDHNRDARPIGDRIAEERAQVRARVPCDVTRNPEREDGNRHTVGEAILISIGGSVLGVLSGALLGWSLTTSIACAVAGFRLAVNWPVETMVAVPLISTLAAGAVAKTVEGRNVGD
jgi:hypothetical protein